MGTNLLAAALRMSDVGVGQISLDVFDDNAQALKWYGRLGFQIRQTSELIEIMPPMTPSEWRAYLSDLPQADLCQERFGFSRFNLVTVQRTWSIGRIGDGWFRLDDAAALGDASVFAALRALDPRRRIFAAVPQFSVAPTIEARLLATTHRMEAEISQVLHTIDLAQ